MSQAWAFYQFTVMVMQLLCSITALYVEFKIMYSRIEFQCFIISCTDSLCCTWVGLNYGHIGVKCFNASNNNVEFCKIYLGLPKFFIFHR